jgi:hypothetical protein
MDRSKLVAVVTGAIALILSIAYLLIVQFLDFRGEMIPAPQDPLLPDWVISADLSSKSPGALGSDV